MHNFAEQRGSEAWKAIEHLWDKTNGVRMAIKEVSNSLYFILFYFLQVEEGWWCCIKRKEKEKKQQFNIWKSFESLFVGLGRKLLQFPPEWDVHFREMGSDTRFGKMKLMSNSSNFFRECDRFIFIFIFHSGLIVKAASFCKLK